MRILWLLVAGAALLSAQAPDTLPEGYVKRTPPKEGLAPKMKVTELSKTGRQFELVFGKGDEIISGLNDFAIKQHLTTAHFTAIGAFDHAVLGWSDPDKKAYKKIPIDQEVEILALTGNIIVTNGKPTVHAHVVVGLPDGTTRGGHVIEAHVSLTLQLFLEDAEPLTPTAAAKTEP